jgi:hypothetical protein
MVEILSHSAVRRLIPRRQKQLRESIQSPRNCKEYNDFWQSLKRRTIGRQSLGTRQSRGWFGGDREAHCRMGGAGLRRERQKKMAGTEVPAP